MAKKSNPSKIPLEFVIPNDVLSADLAAAPYVEPLEAGILPLEGIISHITEAPFKGSTTTDIVALAPTHSNNTIKTSESKPIRVLNAQRKSKLPKLLQQKIIPGDVNKMILQDSPKSREDKMAIASLSLGIVSVVLLGYGFIAGIAAIVLGAIALKRGVRHRGKAIAGIIMGAASILLTFLTIGLLLLFLRLLGRLE